MSILSCTKGKNVGIAEARVEIAARTLSAVSQCAFMTELKENLASATPRFTS